MSLRNGTLRDRVSSKVWSGRVIYAIAINAPVTMV